MSSHADSKNPISPTRPIEPSIARQRELIAQDKANKGTDEKRELAGEGEFASHDGERKLNINAALENPLTGISHERLEAMGRAFAQEKGLGQYETEFAKGAQVAQDPLAFESLTMLSDEDKNVLRREVVSLLFSPLPLGETQEV